MEFNASKPVKEAAFDVVVIGGGGSGLSAAARALENGASVAVIDRNNRFGGCAQMAMSVMAVATPVHRSLGLHTTADEVFRTHMERQAWECNARLCRKWFTESYDHVKWMLDMGVVLNVSMAPSEEYSPWIKPLALHNRYLPDTGKTIVNGLKKHVEELGAASFTNCRAKKLLRDANGSLCGVLAETEDCLIKFSAKAVIIASGSMSGNLELCKKFMPDRAELDDVKIIGGMPFCTGDGYLMAKEVGAKDGYVGTFYIGPHNHPHNLRVGLIQRRPHLIWLNRNGERFCDETMYALHQYSWFASNAITLQPDHICFPMFDQGMLDSFLANKKNYWTIENMQGAVKSKDLIQNAESGTYEEEHRPTAWLDHIISDIEEEVEAGRILKTDSPEEIADWIGAKPGTVEKTLERYNTFCMDGYDADFLRRKDFLIGLSKPPYYVMKGLQGIDSVDGGIEVDHYHRVMDMERRPIPGLFAAGVAASGFFVRNYGYPATCMGSSLYSGYSCGKCAADYAVKGSVK